MASARFRDLVISIPTSWGTRTELMLFGPARGDFKPSVVVTTDPAPKSGKIDAHADAHEKVLTLLEPKLKCVNKGAAKFGKLTGHQREYVFASSGVPMYQRHFYVLAAPVVYTITFTDLAKNAEAARTASEKLFGELSLDAAPRRPA